MWWAQRVLALRETTCVVKLRDNGLEAVDHHLRIAYDFTNSLLWGTGACERLHLLRLHEDVALIRRVAL